MARAKRTDRTEARRRHRAEQAALAAAIAAGEAPEPAEPARSEKAGGSRAAPERPTISGAFRAAFHPLDVRSDLRALPQLLRHWSLWLPASLTVLSAILFVSGTASMTEPDQPPNSTLASIGILAYQLFIAPPPVAAAFLAGFGAPRASWLIGAIVGVVAAFAFVAVVLSPFGRLTYADPGPWIVQGFLFAPVGAALFASAAAWYRRFLNLVNPNRGQPSKARGRQKSRPTSAAGGRAR